MFANDLTSIKWDCVHFIEASDEIPTAELKEKNIKVFEVDGKINDKDSFIPEVGKAMEFPDYSRPNWDSLHECLRDMEWLPASGYVLIIKNARDLWQNIEVAGTFIEIWLNSAESWSKEHKSFHLVFIS